VEEIRTYAERLRELQYLLYAENRRGLLICLQAMDTGGIVISTGMIMIFPMDLRVSDNIVQKPW